MFGIGGFELFLIILFAFLIFGPDKLPALANMLGKAIVKFRNAKDEVTGTLNAQSFLSDDPDQPIKNPIEVLEQAAAKVDAKRNGNKAGGADAAASAKPAAAKPGSAVENYPAFAERKAAYEREQKAKAAQAAETVRSSQTASAGSAKLPQAQAADADAEAAAETAEQPSQAGASAAAAEGAFGQSAASPKGEG